VTWRGNALHDVGFEGSFGDDRLSLGKMAINDGAGTALTASGVIAKVSGQWQFQAMKGDITSKDLGRSLHMLGLDAPLPLPAHLLLEANGAVTGPSVTIAAPALDFGKAHLTDLQALLSVADDKLALDHLKAGLYGGQLSGDGAVAESGDVALHLLLKGAQMRQALIDVADIGLADGALEGEVTLASSGHASSELQAHLKGTASMQVTNGQIKGFDLASADRKLAGNEGLSGLLGLLQIGLNGGATHFSSLTGTAKIDHGLVTSNDLRLVADGGGADGVAQVNLPGDSVDAAAHFHFASARDAPPLTMRLTGSLEYPRRTLDIKPLQQWLTERVLKGGKPKDVLKGLFPGIVK
jgi:uncharacterized protein involved in outer membrane biogenesis